MARRHCGLGAEDWGLASALYEPGSLGKGFTVFGQFKDDKMGAPRWHSWVRVQLLVSV